MSCSCPCSHQSLCRVYTRARSPSHPRQRSETMQTLSSQLQRSSGHVSIFVASECSTGKSLKTKPTTQMKEKLSSYLKRTRRNVWKMGIVSILIRGRDGVVQGPKVRTRKGVLERPIQHLNLRKLSCDHYQPSPTDLNPKAAEFNPRLQRLAIVAAKDRIHAMACAEQE